MVKENQIDKAIISSKKFFTLVLVVTSKEETWEAGDHSGKGTGFFSVSPLYFLNWRSETGILKIYKCTF